MMLTSIIAAHLDDIEYGMGSTLVQMVNNGVKPNILIFCKGRDDENSNERLKSFFTNMEYLGIRNVQVLHYYDMELEMVPLKELSKHAEIFLGEHPTLRVITNSESDIHQDHQLVSRAVKIACRPERYKELQELLEFKIPGNNPFNSCYFDTVNAVKYISEKVLMCNNYKTEKLVEYPENEYFKTIFRKFK